MEGGKTSAICLCVVFYLSYFFLLFFLFSPEIWILSGITFFRGLHKSHNLNHKVTKFVRIFYIHISRHLVILSLRHRLLLDKTRKTRPFSIRYSVLLPFSMISTQYLK